MVSLYNLIYLMASDPMGTNLSLSPLPITLIKPTSIYRQEMRRFTSSLTRKPQLYIVSTMALLRPPSGLLKSICAIMNNKSRIQSSRREFIAKSFSSCAFCLLAAPMVSSSETVNSYELGYKGLINKRLLIDVYWIENISCEQKK